MLPVVQFSKHITNGLSSRETTLTETEAPKNSPVYNMM